MSGTISNDRAIILHDSDDMERQPILGEKNLNNMYVNNRVLRLLSLVHVDCRGCISALRYFNYVIDGR